MNTVVSTVKSVSTSFTKKTGTSAYDALDVVGPATDAVLTFADVVPPETDNIEICGATLRIDINAVPSGMTTFVLHLYSSAPTAIADNAAFNLIAADRAKYLGSITLIAPVDLGDTLWTQAVNQGIIRVASSKSLYGTLQTTAGWTPAASSVFTLSLQVKGA